MTEDRKSNSFHPSFPLAIVEYTLLGGAFFMIFSLLADVYQSV